MEEELVKETARKFRRVNRAMMRIMDKKFSSTQVYRGQHQVLMHIAHHPNATQAEIAESMEISPSALAVMLKKLEKGGYIKRRLDNLDERKKHMEMTMLGKEIVAESHKMFQEMEHQMFRGFSEEELKVLSGFMNRMVENLMETQNVCNKEEK